MIEMMQIVEMDMNHKESVCVMKGLIHFYFFVPHELHVIPANICGDRNCTVSDGKIAISYTK